MRSAIIVAVAATGTWAAHAREALRDRGYQTGAARLAVLELLADEHCCLTPQEMFDGVRAGGRSVGIASVYRAVDLLAELGLLQRVDVGDGLTRYQPVHPGGEHHHHLLCDGCGKVETFHDEPLERALAALGRRAGYELAGHDVVLRGACSDCVPARA